MHVRRGKRSQHEKTGFSEWNKSHSGRIHCQSSKRRDRKREDDPQIKAVFAPAWISMLHRFFHCCPSVQSYLSFCGLLEAWCYSGLFFGHRSALGLTVRQRQCRSAGVCKRGSTLSQRAQFRGSFNAAPVRAQLRPGILQDPACAAVGPIWTSARDRGKDPVSPPTGFWSVTAQYNEAPLWVLWPQQACNLMIWNISVVI